VLDRRSPGASIIRSANGEENTGMILDDREKSIVLLRSSNVASRNKKDGTRLTYPAAA